MTGSERTFLRSTRLIDPQPTLEVRSPDGGYLLSTGDHDIVLRSDADGRSRRLTEDGTADHEWRFDAPCLRAALFGQSRPGVTWSPDSRRVAAYKVDLRGVDRVPQPHPLRGDTVVYRHMTRAGGVLERTTVHVLALDGPAVEVDLGDTTDTYPVAAAWLPDSSGLLVFRLSRDCRRADVLLADAATGKTEPLFSEVGESFVRVHHDVYAVLGTPRLGLWLTPDGRQIVWQSERSGWRHLYLYDLDGTVLRQLTDGDWPVGDVLAIRDGVVYFTGHRDQDRPYDEHLYRVPLAGGPVEALTEGRGVHAIELAADGSTFLDTCSSPTSPPVTTLRTIDGRAVREVSRAELTEEPPEEFTVTAADGETRLWGLLYRPPGFDPARRYPVVEYIYGGPQSTVVPHGYATDGPAQALARRGYVTVLLDGRGTPGRSKAFHDASYLRWANVLADDHAGALLQLAERYDFIDASRIGIVGHSWGGYSAFRCLADRPDVYRAAVCSAAGFDATGLVLYECYLDLPERNPDGYAFADCSPLVTGLDGAVMLAVGTSDHPNWAETLRMSEALIQAGKEHELVVLPEQFHAYDTVHDDYFWRKAAGFFAQHLGDPR
jgi:dipeptidyl aminopeptidase/acylaminoacyl peptidase